MIRIAVLALIAALVAAPVQAQTVVIVRHGEKAAPTRDPDLSAAGQARAQALAAALANARVRTVVVTTLKRTQQTAKPTATAANVNMITVPLDGTAAFHAQLVAVKARQAPTGSTVLIVGHSDTVGEIAKAMGDPAPQPIPDCAYDRMTIIQLDAARGPRTLHARYGTPTC
jgi:broad specificity phosphatase PhoE